MNIAKRILIFVAALLSAAATPNAHAQAAATNIPSIHGIASTTNKDVGLTIYGYSGVTYSVNASTNLFTWQQIGTVGLASSGAPTPGYMSFLDTNAPLFRCRFYNVSGTNPVFTATTNPTVTVLTTNATQAAPYNLPVTLTVIAQNFPNGIASITLWDGDNYAGGLNNPPGTNSFAWSSIVPGLHVFFAAATDLEGNTTWSQPTYLTVATDVGATVAITSPQAGQTLTNGAFIPFSATAANPEASVSWLAFFCDGYYVGWCNSPYTLVWTRFASLPSGSHQVYAVAYDAYGVAGESAPVTFNIAVSPSVTVSPQDGSTYPASGSIPVSVTVSNTPGDVTNLVILTNGALWLSFTSAAGQAPSVYNTNWANAPAGVCTLSAMAYDDTGALTDSQTNTVYVFTDVSAAMQPVVAVAITNAIAPFDAPTRHDVLLRLCVRQRCHRPCRPSDSDR
jgi:hypothetical protein